MARANLQSNFTRTTWCWKNIIVSWLRHRSYLPWVSGLFHHYGIANSIIKDDIMYMALDEREATLFFQLIHQLYEQSSIILTSNRSPEEWTELVDNQGMMTAILDRLLHRVEIIHMDNESYRMKHQQKIFD